MERKKTKNKPPDNWFQTYHPPGSDTVSVGMSDEFRNMENGEVGRHMNQWINYTRIQSTQTAFSSEERTIAEEVTKEAEAFITKVTGFSPQIIWNRAITLHQQSKAQTAPFSSNGTK